MQQAGILYDQISPFQLRISGPTLDHLLRPATKAEIKRVVWATTPSKSPGPDSLQAGFYQKSWDIVGDSVYQSIKEAFRQGTFQPKVCEAFLCQISKEKNAVSITKFRPIALCNVLYKFVMKCITIRL